MGLLCGMEEGCAQGAATGLEAQQGAEGDAQRWRWQGAPAEEIWGLLVLKHAAAKRFAGGRGSSVRFQGRKA